jgi:hypothetical protein
MDHARRLLLRAWCPQNRFRSDETVSRSVSGSHDRSTRALIEHKLLAVDVLIKADISELQCCVFLELPLSNWIGRGLIIADIPSASIFLCTFLSVLHGRFHELPYRTESGSERNNLIWSSE